MSKNYDDEFKLDSLKYREDNPQLTDRAVARNLDINAPTFYNWQRVVNENIGDVLHRGSGNHLTEEAK